MTWTTTLTASRRHWKLTMGLLTQLRREVKWHRDRLHAPATMNATGRVPKEETMAHHANLGRTFRSGTNAALTSCMIHRRWKHSLDLVEALGRFATQPNQISYTTCFAAFRVSADGSDYEAPPVWVLTVRLLHRLRQQCSPRDASLLADAAARSAACRSEPWPRRYASCYMYSYIC